MLSTKLEFKIDINPIAAPIDLSYLLFMHSFDILYV